MPPPTAMASPSPSFDCRGAPASPRRLTEIRSNTAQARNEANSTMPPASPFTSRCARAQIFTATSIGCRSSPRITPGAGPEAAREMKASHIKGRVRCRVQPGGLQTGIRPAARYWPKPQTISPKPTKDTSE